MLPDRADPRFHDLLRNDKGDNNVDGKIECEINVWRAFRDQHEEWVASLVNGGAEQVTAIGVWVEDTGHANKTELHPVDVVFGPFRAPGFPATGSGIWRLSVGFSSA